MTEIKCVNSECTSPTGTFMWDESNDVEPGSTILGSATEGANSIVIGCNFCGCENKLWILGGNVRRSNVVKRGGGGGGVGLRRRKIKKRR